MIYNLETNISLFSGSRNLKKKKQCYGLVLFFLKKNSHLAPKVPIESQENLAKSGYKTNREIKKNLGILLRKLRNLRKSSKIFMFS
jgi:hypothetical protein